MDLVLISILQDLAKQSKGGNIPRLKELGGEIAQEAYVRGDRRLVNLIVISYAIAKFLEKHYIRDSKPWEGFFAQYLFKLQEAIEELKNNHEDEFQVILESIIADVGKLNEETGRFQSTIIEKARIKAGTQIYAHGASLSMAASFAGVDMAALASYINVTKLPEKYGTLSVKERLKFAYALFGIKE
ncbi:hypothetical protein HY989_00530 [Candidatus Micrarchaeota archaeon]|nr:hypothetical protein [Candidatus Micrarchaeota archaeon]